MQSLLVGARAACAVPRALSLCSVVSCWVWRQLCRLSWAGCLYMLLSVHYSAKYLFHSMENHIQL